MRRKVKELEHAVLLLDESLDLGRFMNRMPIDNQEHRSLGTYHQALEELEEDARVNAPLMQHEAQLTTWADGRKHVDGKPATRAADHRRLPLGRSGRARVIVRAHARLVGKVDRCPHATGFRLDGGKEFELPLLHQYGILLPGLMQWALRREPKGLHHTVRCCRREPHAHLALNQVTDQTNGPQAELESQLQGRFVAYCLGNPGYLLIAQGGRASRNGFGDQRRLAAIGKRRQSAKDAAWVDPERRCHIADSLSFTHGFDGLHVHSLKCLMIVGSTVGRLLAFHASDYK